MNYKQDVLEMLVFELREQFKGSCAIVLTTENGLYSEFYANRDIVDFIKFRVQEYYPEFHYVDSLRNAKYPGYPADVRDNLDKRLKDFTGFSCSKELIDYLRTNVPYRADFVIFCATKCSPKRSYATPQTNAFSYDSSTEMLTIAGKKDCKVFMHPKDVVAFMNSISAIKSNIWSPSCDDIKNTVDALRSMLIKENYKKLDGPIDCEVWGVF